PPSGPTHEQWCRALYDTGTGSPGLPALRTPAHTRHSKHRDNAPANSRQVRKVYSADIRPRPEPGV
ncbi:hypothetical protein, partial [Corynebacterium amycolatum]|uniref:hypothetical protein n=1 Tax=Corynebacterium amycolatum TaxID=43765 RepID=UPI003161E1C9